MSGAKSGKRKGGLLGAFGRLFGGARSGELDAPDEPAPGGGGQSEAPATGSPAAEAGAAGEEEDALVLGPALQLPAAGSADDAAAPREAGPGAEEEVIFARLHAARAAEPPVAGSAGQEHAGSGAPVEAGEAGATGALSDQPLGDARAAAADDVEGGGQTGVHWLFGTGRLEGEAMDSGDDWLSATEAEPLGEASKEADDMGRSEDGGAEDGPRAADDREAAEAGPAFEAEALEAEHGTTAQADDMRPAGEQTSGEAEAAPDVPQGSEVEGGVAEETLRRLIREELEGELGERLSANIRRMIREEVAHALLRQS